MGHEPSQLQRIAQSGGLPEIETTRSGVIFYPREEIWQYRDGLNDVKLDWTKLRKVSANHLMGMKVTMVWYAKHGSPTSLPLYITALELWADINETPAMSAQEFYRFRTLCESKRVVGHAKAFLRRWHRLGVPGVSDDLIKALSATQEKRVNKNVAVATMDPNDGPYTDIELQGLLGALTDAFGSGRISERDHALAWLFAAIGSRPVQLASLKVKDVHRRGADGQYYYDIDVPRAKQRGVLRRSEFKNRALTVQIGTAVHTYAESVKQQFASRLKDPNEAPLFPQFEKLTGEWSEGFEYHVTPAHLGQMLRNCLSALRVHSERTGAPMKVNAIRFRRTVGTRAAQEGHGALVIAELLDHNDIQHVGVYVESRNSMAERIDKAMAFELAPLAQAFKGKLVLSASEAARGNDSSARIRDLRFGDKDEGFCGTHSFCGFDAPIACYTCNSFEPWVDGPHESVLEYLLAKRTRQVVTTDKRIASINDRTILAVAEVVQLCREQMRRIGSE